MRIVVLTAVLWASVVPLAYGEISSVDAYGGQAAVLGKHKGGPHRGSRSPSAGKSSPSRGERGRASRSAATGTGVGADATSISSRSSSSSPSRHGAARSTGESPVPLSERALARTEEKGGGLPFGDLLVLVLLLLLVVTVGLAMRRLTRATP